MAATRYIAVIERTRTGYSAYLPDVPGCVSTGETPEEAKRNLAEALRLHAEGLAEDGESLPPPSTTVADISPDDAVSV